MSTVNKPIHTRIHLLEIDVEFPFGLSAGAGSFGNRILLARNGRGELVLHGTAIAGVLRHAYHRLHPNTDISRWFGAAQGDDHSTAQRKASPLRVDDACLDVGETGLGGSTERVSHLRCRHTGSVADKALYSIEAAPPKTTATLRFRFEEANLSEAGKNFIGEIVGLFHRGIIFGGNSNRGVGLARIVKETKDSNAKNVRYKSYDVTQANGFAVYLNDDYALRDGGTLEKSEPLDAICPSADNTLRVDFTLEIPKGQDLLVSDGQGLDAESEPHRVTGADKKDYWLLPGSSLHGLFRDWITRIAAREGKTVADSVEQFEKNNRTVTGDDLGWMFQKDRKDDPSFLNEIDANYPVESMFGSLHKAGRLYISDGLSPVGDTRTTSELAVDDKFPVQYRAHVAIDPISGGAIEGALFDNYVLTSGGDKNAVSFPITLLLRDAKEDEVRWLAETLCALHTGLLRVGSSKSAGRLAVKEGSLKVDGAFAEFMKTPVSNLPEDSWQKIEEEITAVMPQASAPSEPLASLQIPTIKGILQKKEQGPGKISYQVLYTNAKGKEVPSQVSSKAKCFNDKDAVDKMEVDLVIEKGQVIKVTIPGKAEITPTSSGAASSSQGRYNARQNSYGQNRGNTGKQQTDTNKLSKANPSVLGMPFHNPYTFIPFSQTAPERKPVTLQTSEESERTRFTGTLELHLKTITPLLTSEGWCQEAKECARQGKKVEDTGNHKLYNALRIGNDVILPATGVRGFLRQLVTIVTGGPISVMNEETYLCQGRDLQLTPRTSSEEKTPAILARIIKPGNSMESGTIEIGETRLIREDTLKDIYGSKYLPRPKAGERIQWLWAEWKNGQIVSIQKNKDAAHSSQLKISGQPVMTKKWDSETKTEVIIVKKEGIFICPITGPITLPATYWAAYNSRNGHGFRPELKEGDLVWIEPRQLGMNCGQIQSADDIASLQWARWGRRGVKVGNVMPAHMIPDSHRDDPLVSGVTDLFGQVPIRQGSKGKTFKGRIACDNLVFTGGILDIGIDLAVMGMPHAGCVPFYRNNTDSNKLCVKDPLRGYKVYRMEKPGNQPAPWLFTTQGVYDDSGLVKKDARQKVNITVDLLKPGAMGTVTLSLRSLSHDELALILYLCHGTWRLGGGKPLSLGACQVTEINLRDESGNPVDPNAYPMNDENIKKRFGYWNKTQFPVEKLRYPRSVVRNNNKNSRGGMTWFQKCATMKKGAKEGELPTGLTPIYVCDELMERARKNGAANQSLGDADLVSGQVLPFSPNSPQEEFLYGYDAFFVDSADYSDTEEIKKRQRRKQYFNGKNQECYPEIVPFDETKHITGREASGGNYSSNRDTRQGNKRDRDNN